MHNIAAPPLPAPHLHIPRTTDTPSLMSVCEGRSGLCITYFPDLLSFSSAINCALAKIIYFKKSVIFSWPWAKMPWKPSFRASKLCIWKLLHYAAIFYKFTLARRSVFGETSITRTYISNNHALIFQINTLTRSKENRSDRWRNEMQNTWRIQGQLKAFPSLF